MATIKQIPQDFVVIEKTIIKPKESQEGNDYTYYLLKKIDHTTINALKFFSEKAHTDLNKIGFAGTKDKKAVTQQYFSVFRCGIKELKKINIDISLVGYGKKPISLGDLEGNEFIITVRKIDKMPKIPSNLNFLNLFDEQRFSSNNVEIGRALIKKEFKKVVSLMIKAKKSDSSYEADVERHIEKSPTDFVGALMRIPKKLLTMFIHSYQSEIWNKTALKIRDNPKYKNLKLPLVGFGTEFEDEEIEEIMIGYMKKDGITQRDFIIRELKELSSEGATRDLFVGNVTIKSEILDDEINKGKKKAILHFSLPKGSYATRVIKEIFGELESDQPED